jgi:hypothetical protein
MKKSPSTFLIRVCLGAFFIIIGVFGVLPQVDESIFSLRNSFQWLEVLFGCVEIACGVFLVASAFLRLAEKTTRAASLIVLVFWLLRIFLSKVVWGLDFNNGLAFLPSFSQWLLALSVELVIAAALFHVQNSVKD